MRRVVRRASTRPQAWFLGLMIPVGLIVGVFALASSKLLTGKWPFGIKADEVRMFVNLKGTLLEDPRAQGLPVLRIGGATGHCPVTDYDDQWRSIEFTSEHYSSQAEVAHLGPVPGSFSIRFPESRPFEQQHRINLVPATIQNIRSVYLEVLATELELPVAEVSFVRIIACGKDLGIYQKEEDLGRAFLAKKRLADATLFNASADPNCPQGMFPNTFSDPLMGPELVALWSTLYTEMANGDTEALNSVLDKDASVSWLLMRWLENGDPTVNGTVPYIHRRTTGKVSPVYQRVPEYGNGPSAFTMDPVSALLQQEEFRTSLIERREELNDLRWRMKERFAAMDNTWLPLLAEKGDLAWARATANRIANVLLEDRLENGDPLAYHNAHWVAGPGRATFIGNTSGAGPVLVQALEGTTPIEEVARWFFSARTQGDTLVLNRGKYYLKDDVVLPPGKALVINEGARITMAPGSGIMVQGPLHIRGSRLRPVFIRAANDAQPFKGIAMRGDGKALCHVSGLYISGGGAAGDQVSIRGAINATFDGCEIEAAKGHGLEISGGHVTLVDVNFYGGTGPLLALEHARSEVRECNFRSSRRSTVGSGVLINGERSMIQDCNFTGMTNEAITVGSAGQLLLLECEFDGNNTVVKGSDLALIHASGNRFSSNGTVFKLQRIDPIQGGARVIRYPNEFTDNKQESAVDDHSGIDEKETLDPKIISDFGGKDH
ncbi:MAG: right-handed parallel beta-helix repeat-containing protein [Flavobacteriales bacterium]|nr:right-handed parallel beta-helix repeat-containing protein [Flavobacteriales bacterium]